MDKKLYELIRDLTTLADIGVDDMQRNADGEADRLRVAEGKATLVIAQHYVDEYAEQYKHGDLS